MSAVRHTNTAPPLYALLPFAALVKRELIRSLRTTRPFLFLCLIVLLAVVVVYANYPGHVSTTSTLRMHSMLILGQFVFILLAAAVLLLPGYAATAIVVEREQDTFDQLTLTLTRPMAILLGKLANTIGFFLLIELAMLPLLGATFFLVGIESGVAVSAAVYLLIVAVSCACSGILASVACRTTSRAVFMAYATAFIVLGGYLIPPALIGTLFSIWGMGWLVRLFSPAALFLLSSSPAGSVGAITGLAMGGTSLGFLIKLAFGQGMFWFGMLAVARRMLIRPVEERNFTSVVLATPRPVLGPPPLPDVPPFPELPSWANAVQAVPVSDQPRGIFRGDNYAALPPWPPVSDSKNPLFARELLQARLNRQMTPLRFVFGSICLLIVMVFLAIVVSDVYSNSHSSAAQTMVSAWMVGLTMLTSLAATAFAATSWTREYERESMDLLRATLLRPRQLVMAKVGAALVACLLPLVLTIIASLPIAPLVFASPRALFQFGSGAITLVVSCFLSVSISMRLGLFIRRTPAAILYGVAGTLFVLFWPLVVEGMQEIARLMSPRHSSFLTAANWFDGSPLLSYATSLAAAGTIRSANLESWLFSMAGNSVLALLLLWSSISAFRRNHLQDP